MAPVIAANAMMATMQTTSPTEFVRLMRWLAAEVGRQGIQGGMAQSLADVVKKMQDDGVLVETGHAPASIG